ncbi:MAG: hypothetical protein ABDH37_07580 [Candidatus Hydrothermales bacterium]
MKRIILLMVVWILIGGYCPTEEERRFKRNPNLELFLSDTLCEEHYFSPVFSPDGKKVYCIVRKLSPIQNLLVSINIEDKKIDTIVRDSVLLFALNHRGDEIAYVKGKTDDICEDPWSRLNNEDKIVFINTLTQSVIKEFNPFIAFVCDLEYTHDDSFLIFLGYGDTAKTGFYSLELTSLKETLLVKVIANKRYTFTLHPENDSIFYSDSLWYPEFNPLNSSEFVFSNDQNASQWLSDEPWYISCELYLYDLKENTKVSLNAKPYYYTSFGKISFSPCGRKIIFSAARPLIWESVDFSRQELWILNLK